MKPKNLTRILFIIVILLSISLTITAAKLVSINRTIKATNDVKPHLEEELNGVIDKKPTNEENNKDNESLEESETEKPQETIEEPAEPIKIDKPSVNHSVENKQPIIEVPPSNEDNHNPGNDNNEDDKVDEDDDEKYVAIIEPKYISEETAIDIALKKIGKKSTVLEIEQDFEDNPPKYEIKIKKNKWEYEIEIHARTGAILDYEKEKVE